MGVLYLATCPEGKGYVGQTKHTMTIRWAQHASEARRKDFNGGCWKLNQAIVKHGAGSFRLLKLWECPEEELDEWEIYFVELFDTFGPNGYNLTEGGRGWDHEYSQESKDKMSKSQRKNFYGDKELPSYVYYMKDDMGEGFRVRVGEKFYRVMTERLTMDEKLERALELRRAALDGTNDETKDRRRKDPASVDLPKHIRYDARREGYYVRKPGHPDKSFTSAKIPKEERLQQALDYLASLN